MSKRILITGVGGSIGCHVLRHVLKHTDWHVIGLDSFRHKGLTDRVQRVTYKHRETLSRLTVYTHDLTAPISSLLERKIGKIDYIINLASISDVDRSIDEPGYVITNNVELMVNVLDYARRVRPTTFLQVSTDEVYGPTDGRTAHKEWDPIVPSNAYSASKACQEAIAIAYWRSYGVPLIIVNLMNNFGEMQSPSKFPAMVQRRVRANESIGIHRFEDGYGSRFYIHSRNAADAMWFLLRQCRPHLHKPGTVDRPSRYNIVGDEQINNLTMAYTIAAAVGKDLKWYDVDCAENRPGHDAHYGLDGTKLKEAGWTSPCTFEQSMKETVTWYERNPEWLDL
jgi:dTDP-glucose 4,6-dehydratase